MLCELARTDRHRFRVLEPDSDQTKALRALTRAREDLVGARTGIVNQLRAELERFWPGPLTLFSHMDAEILLAFLERYPSPADAHGLGVARMHAFLEREHLVDEESVAAEAGDLSDELWERLNAAVKEVGAVREDDRRALAGALRSLADAARTLAEAVSERTND